MANNIKLFDKASKELEESIDVIRTTTMDDKGYSTGWHLHKRQVIELCSMMQKELSDMKIAFAGLTNEQLIERMDAFEKELAKLKGE